MLQFFQIVSSGFFALAGVTLLWLLQRRDKAEDRRQKKLELLRQKAEEIYQELVEVTEGAKAVVYDALAFEHDQAPPGPSPQRNEGAKLKALLRMYFPRAEGILSQFEEEMLAAFEPTRKYLEVSDSLPLEVKRAEMKKAKRATADESVNATIRMTAKVRAFMDQEVKKLL